MNNNYYYLKYEYEFDILMRVFAKIFCISIIIFICSFLIDSKLTSTALLLFSILIFCLSMLFMILFGFYAYKSKVFHDKCLWKIKNESKESYINFTKKLNSKKNNPLNHMFNSIIDEKHIAIITYKKLKN